MSCCKSDITIFETPTYVRESIWRNRSKSTFGISFFLFLDFYFWIISFCRLANSLYALLANNGINSRELHGSCKTCKAFHRGHSNLSFYQNGWNLNLCGAINIYSIAFTSLNWKVQVQFLCELLTPRSCSHYNLICGIS